MPTDAFDESDECSLYLAAGYPDAAISKAIYEHNVKFYQAWLADPKKASPLSIAIKYSLLEQIEFLSTIKPLQPHDLILDNGKHAFYLPAFSGNKLAFDVVKLLINRGAHLGNEIVTLGGNALASCATSTGSYAKQIMELMLPLANFQSKYMGMLSASNELYYCYDRKERSQLELTDSSAVMYQELRNIILNSLTTEECAQISDLHSQQKFADCRGERILKNDLLNFELQLAKQKGQNNLVNYIQRCFGMKVLEEKTSTDAVTPFWKPKPADTYKSSLDSEVRNLGSNP